MRKQIAGLFALIVVVALVLVSCTKVNTSSSDDAYSDIITAKAEETVEESFGEASEDNAKSDISQSTTASAGENLSSTATEAPVSSEDTAPVSNTVSTVPQAPPKKMPAITKMIVYKNSEAYEVTNPEKLEQVRALIESWFSESDTILGYSLIVDEALIKQIESEETAVELFLDEYRDENCITEFKSLDKLLIPLSGEHRYMIFESYKNKYMHGPIRTPLTRDKLSLLNDIVDSLQF